MGVPHIEVSASKVIGWLLSNYTPLGCVNSNNVSMHRSIKTVKHQSIDIVTTNMTYQYDAFLPTIKEVNPISMIGISFPTKSGLLLTINTKFQIKTHHVDFFVLQLDVRARSAHLRPGRIGLNNGRGHLLKLKTIATFQGCIFVYPFY
jgi:hypothetical protein